MTRTRSLVVPILLLVACDSRLCRDPRILPTGDRSTQKIDAPVPPRPALNDPRVWRVSEYTAPRISTPPVIDGKLDDAVWQNIPWTPDFWSSMAFSAPTHRTRAKLAWDDQNIYVAFDVEDNDMISRDPKTGEPYNHDDDTLYMSEAVEIFLDADNSGDTYNELEISPLDHIFDASFTARRQGMDTGWNSGVKHAIDVHGTVNDSSDIDQGWTAELAIPIANLMAVPHRPPQIGERWRFNMFRLDHGKDVGEQGQAFSPVMIGDFHNLPKYGFLILGGPK